MSVLLYVHQLFNVDQCHAYIHTLRWCHFQKSSSPEEGRTLGMISYRIS
jgi:hypothetical protein